MVRVTGELAFTTSLGGKRIVRIPDPAAIISQGMLDAAESGIMTANPFDETIGNLIALKSAQRVNVNRITLI